MKNKIHLTLLLIALSFGSSCKALDEVIDINQLAFGGCVPLDIYDAVELLKKVVDQSII